MTVCSQGYRVLPKTEEITITIWVYKYMRVRFPPRALPYRYATLPKDFNKCLIVLLPRVRDIA